MPGPSAAVAPGPGGAAMLNTAWHLDEEPTQTRHTLGTHLRQKRVKVRATNTPERLSRLWSGGGVRRMHPKFPAPCFPPEVGICDPMKPTVLLTDVEGTLYWEEAIGAERAREAFDVAQVRCPASCAVAYRSLLPFAPHSALAPPVQAPQAPQAIHTSTQPHLFWGQGRGFFSLDNLDPASVDPPLSFGGYRRLRRGPPVLPNFLWGWPQPGSSFVSVGPGGQQMAAVHERYQLMVTEAALEAAAAIDGRLWQEVERICVFARMSPQGKAKVWSPAHRM